MDQGRGDDRAGNRAVYVDSSRDRFIREKELRADSHISQSAALVKRFMISAEAARTRRFRDDIARWLFSSRFPKTPRAARYSPEAE